MRSELIGCAGYAACGCVAGGDAGDLHPRGLELVAQQRGVLDAGLAQLLEAHRLALRGAQPVEQLGVLLVEIEVFCHCHCFA